MDPDRALVEAAAGGSREAFDELVRRHQGAMITLARVLTSGRGDAEDLAQDVFVRAWRSIGGFRGESTFRTWLHRVAINVDPDQPVAAGPADAGVHAARSRRRIVRSIRRAEKSRSMRRWRAGR